ncbi:hypothetical protein GALMADRAFT_257992 [Galerina marginata CBS 339.88]|uniref:F-box domain-containing protein n=1 Tax=Galerina marginata (strain CBS 339.88) TaxID=685588 RepID=A0A067SIZ3_GALM3|nr:hypothetical protein GALMADRAFT_257992 [Galerina marginata CBS 339.88]
MDLEDVNPIDQLQTSTIDNVPPEILIMILTNLDSSDILRVRQTCRTLCKTSYDRVIWMSLLQEQLAYLPMPPELARIYHREDRLLQSYSTCTIESTVVKAQRTAAAWVMPRAVEPYKLKKEVGSNLMGLRMFLDRWLLALYSEGVVHLYDTQPQGKSRRDIEGEIAPVLRASLIQEMPNLWTSFAARMDPSGETLVLALSCSLSPHVVEIFEINFASLPQGHMFLTDAFRLVRTINLPAYYLVQAIDMVERLLFISTQSVVEIINWSDEDYDLADLQDHQRKVMRVRPEDLEGLWNGTVAVRPLGSSGYLLVFKTRCLEVHKSPSSNKPSPPPLKHGFFMTFREVSVSECSVSRSTNSEMETYEVTLFAYDVIQGLFHYTVRLSLPLSRASEVPPSLDVQLTGIYPLALGIVEPASSSASDSGPASSITYSANFSPTPTFTHTHANHHGTSSTPRQTHGRGSDYASRGFLSAHSLGLQGKRAVWVERKRSSTVREVQVWCPEPPSVSPVYVSGRLDGGDNQRVLEMKRRVVCSFSSYDLRDDITHCTLGEVNGTIVLGHRSGDISIIRLNH